MVPTFLFQDFTSFRQLLGIIPVKFLAFLLEIDGFNVLVFLYDVPGLG